ncbi:hypothetical protein H5410_010682 [Solanum commersonii]|uniref:Beta-hydroxyacyl-ACP dehydratase n=1 Tax=Solanum commersonii TaxID=4109 RepID=A0A9J6ALD4_SOLCO|nr:hypothetical protein H5410_010682 [Solanum commersonii]
MASMVISQSVFSTPTSQRFENASFPLPSSMLKQSLVTFRSHSLSTHCKKIRNSVITNCAAPDNDSKIETPIELRYPAFPTVMDINQIREVLPHRFPFLLVDRVIEYNPGVSAVAIKNVTINDNFFPGHFPERPIMPGVLMVEISEIRTLSCSFCGLVFNINWKRASMSYASSRDN